MSVHIEIISDTDLLVNGKRVYKDTDGDWIGQNLNTAELKFAEKHIASLETINKQVGAEAP